MELGDGVGSWQANRLYGAGPYPIQHIVVASGTDGPRWVCGHVNLGRVRGRGQDMCPGQRRGSAWVSVLTRMVLSVDVVYKVPSECLIPVI